MRSQYLQQSNKEVLLAGDFMYVNKTPFLMMISCHIQVRTTQYLINQKGPIILASLKGGDPNIAPTWFSCHPPIYGWTV